MVKSNKYAGVESLGTGVVTVVECRLVLLKSDQQFLFWGEVVLPPLCEKLLPVQIPIRYYNIILFLMNTVQLNAIIINAIIRVHDGKRGGILAHARGHVVVAFSQLWR